MSGPSGPDQPGTSDGEGRPTPPSSTPPGTPPGKGSPADDRPPDDEAFELAYAAWRQFLALRLDQPVPTQPEIDARLLRYRRSREAAALAEFGSALAIVAGIAQALTHGAEAVARVTNTAEALVFLFSAVLLVTLAQRGFRHLRTAVESRALARRIDVEPLDSQRIDTLFADVRDRDVREYVGQVLQQHRPLRKAEAAVALDRGRGARGPDDASRAAFLRFVRDRDGIRAREIAVAGVCLVAVLAARTQALDAICFVAGLDLLAGALLAGMTHGVLQLAADPWQLVGGGHACRQLRRTLWTDLAPQLAIFIALATTISVLPAPQ